MTNIGWVVDSSMNTKKSSDESWDFRDKDEQALSSIYEAKGYIVTRGQKKYLDRIKRKILKEVINYVKDSQKRDVNDEFLLEEIHEKIKPRESNNLRLAIMKGISTGNEINYEYFNAAKNVINTLCGNELAMQKRIGLSVNLPNNTEDSLPVHADTWNGVSPYALNIWIPLVDCKKSMCLYILEREKYEEAQHKFNGLLLKDSEQVFNELKNKLTWIDIKFGDILAFDQSLPHGFTTNQENDTHWSLNCRFKSIYSPYWDKKLGEYYMPITIKSCTRLGIDYKHPSKWL